MFTEKLVEGTRMNTVIETKMGYISIRTYLTRLNIASYE